MSAKKRHFLLLCRFSHLLYVLNSFILVKDIFYHLKQLRLFKLPKILLTTIFVQVLSQILVLTLERLIVLLFPFGHD